MSRCKEHITEYRNYYLPDSFPVLLLSGDYWKISDIPSGRLHFHNCLEIGICHSDSGIMEFYGQPYSFKEGDFTIIPRNIPHTTYSTPGTSSHWTYLMLDPQKLFQSILPDNWKKYDLTPYAFHDFKFILSKEQYPALYYLLIHIINELEEKKTFYQANVRALLLSLYIEVYRVQSISGQVDGGESNNKRLFGNNLVIAPALDFIEDNYMQQFTIEDLASQCHWSPTHFRRVFHETMGTSPLEFVNNTRITKACSLLSSTEESILNISESVGFHSVSSFNRCFMKIMQMSPREYRKQCLTQEGTIPGTSIMEYAGWMYPE